MYAKITQEQVWIYEKVSMKSNFGKKMRSNTFSSCNGLGLPYSPNSVPPLFLRSRLLFSGFFLDMDGQGQVDVSSENLETMIPFDLFISVHGYSKHLNHTVILRPVFSVKHQFF